MKSLSEQRKKELRDTVRKQPNGDYAISICLGCGEFRSDPDGNVDTCSFVRECRNCIDWDEYNEFGN